MYRAISVLSGSALNDGEKAQHRPRPRSAPPASTATVPYKLGTVDEVAALRAELAAALAEIARLRGLLGLDRPAVEAVDSGRLFPVEASASAAGPASGSGTVDRLSSPESKLALFARLFAVRRDVYALRWENPLSDKSGWAPVRRGR